jgi:hypothetical protein
METTIFPEKLVITYTLSQPEEYNIYELCECLHFFSYWNKCARQEFILTYLTAVGLHSDTLTTQMCPWTSATIAWSGHRGYRKNPLPLPGIEPRSPGRPVRIQTLYCLSYPAPFNTFNIM